MRVWLPVFVHSVYCGMSHSDSDSDSGPQQSKKEYVFTNKKDAVDAFKNLLRDKVSILFAGYLIWILCLQYAIFALLDTSNHSHKYCTFVRSSSGTLATELCQHFIVAAK